MKNSILSSLIAAQLITGGWMIITENFPSSVSDWARAISFSSFMGIGCGVASALSIKVSGKPNLINEQKPKTNLSHEQIILGKINKMIAEGAITPEVGVSVKEAIANQISEEIISENYSGIL